MKQILLILAVVVVVGGCVNPEKKRAVGKMFDPVIGLSYREGLQTLGHLFADDVKTLDDGSKEASFTVGFHGESGAATVKVLYGKDGIAKRWSATYD
jgi:hypothetical protein